MAISADYAYDAEICLAEAVDYVVNDCKMDADSFIDAMIVSGYAERFSRGNADVIAGNSGIELAMCSLSAAGWHMNFPDAEPVFERRPAYWCGYIMGHYICRRNVSIKTIHERLNMQQLLRLYPVYHEMDEEKCVEYLDLVIFPDDTETRLRKMRKRLRFTQEKLAQLTGVSKSAITQYERREKDINKASADTLYKLSDVLCCSITDLMEKGAGSQNGK